MWCAPSFKTRWKLADPTVEIQLQPGDMADRTIFPLVAMKDFYLVPGVVTKESKMIFWRRGRDKLKKMEQFCW